MKYLFRRDTFFATFAVFISMGMLALLPLNLSVLNPFRVALEDFDFNDMAYSELKKNQETPVDDRIAIVNIGYSDRLTLSRILEVVSADSPKVIGLDVMFDNDKDSLSDAFLFEQLKATPNLVLASKIDWSNDQILKESVFKDTSIKLGFVNFVGTQKGTIRYFSPIEKENNHVHLSFASAITQKADPHAYQKLLDRKKTIETINYTRHQHKYALIDGAQLLEGLVVDNIFKNKIVLLGYVSTSPFDIEDKYLTPMNEKFAGKTFPDMNGVMIHANIISMILDGSYIKKIPSWITWSLAIILTWLHISLFIRYYIDEHIWFHLVAKIAQLISAIFFVYLGLFLFNRFNVKLDMSITVVAIILAIDVLYFYEALALWLHKKFNYQTIFHTNSHNHET